MKWVATDEAPLWRHFTSLSHADTALRWTVFVERSLAESYCRWDSCHTTHDTASPSTDWDWRVRNFAHDRAQNSSCVWSSSAWCCRPPHQARRHALSYRQICRAHRLYYRWDVSASISLVHSSFACSARTCCRDDAYRSSLDRKPGAEFFFLNLFKKKTHITHWTW